MKNKEMKNEREQTRVNLEEQLSPHFTLREMIASGKAIRLGIENVPTPEAVVNLRALCQNVLEPLRRHMGCVRVTSGYRSDILNGAVGGAKHSQHLRGEAADLHCSSLDQARRWYGFIRDNLEFDQLLLERRLGNGCCWLHVSYVRQPGHRQNRKDSRFVTAK